jgi:hypothetical protein
VAEENLEGAQIDTGVEPVGGAGVAEPVWMDMMWNASPAPSLSTQVAEGAILQRVIRVLLRGKQPLLRLAPAVIDAQPFQQSR